MDASITAITDEDAAYQYQLYKRSLTVCIWLTVAFILTELLLTFIGITIVYMQMNLINGMLHSIGTVLTAWFVFEYWTYQYLWAIFAFLS